LRLFLKGIRNKIESLDINGIDFFRILDSKSNREKYFYFREQGVYAFKNGIDQRGDYLGETYLLDKISFSNSDIIIDIGANSGDLLIYFENKKLNIKYIGFEPGKFEFETLKMNNLNGALHNFALGSTDCEMNFYYKPDSGDSSLIEMNGFSAIHKVSVKSLDSIIQNEPIKLIKLEAEGFEPEILIGAKNIIAKTKYISADLGFERGKEQHTTAPQVINYLLSKNFEVIGISQDRLCVLFKNNSLLCAE
jgi:FkbM family methyltransferase